MSESRSSTEEPSLAKRQKNDQSNGADCSGGDTYDLLTNRIDKDDSKLFAFVRWCVEYSPKFRISNKKLTKQVYMGIKGSAANYGMIAFEDMEPGEEICRIPLERTLYWENLRSADKLRPEIEKMAVVNRWTPTILAIMLEDGVEKSNWSEYLRLFLRANELSIPLLWEDDVLSQLQGLGIAERVRKDRARVEADFRNWIFPVLLREMGLNESAFDGLLKHAYRVAAFVMSYSFTRPQSDEESAANQENSPDHEDSDDDEEATTVGNALAEVPLMIPVADFLNASVHKNNAKLHWNESEEKFLSMICTKSISAGEEVYNTYGEISSEEMLYLYGYAEDGPINPHEEVFIPSEYLKDVVHSALTIEGARIDQRWEYLLKWKIVGPDLPVVLGLKAILTDDDFHEAIRVITMTNEQFNVLVGEEDLIETESVKEGLYSIEKLKALPTAVKLILKLLIQKKISDYPQRYEEYEAEANRCRHLVQNDVGEDMARNGVNVVLARRAFYVAYVRMRQTQILNSYLAELS